MYCIGERGNERLLFLPTKAEAVRKKDRIGTERNGTERNGTERNGTALQKLRNNYRDACLLLPIHDGSLEMLIVAVCHFIHLSCCLKTHSRILTSRVICHGMNPRTPIIILGT
jgi:hypothetical protein